jgi:ABC-2 type transport system ATP-binding protein
VEERYDDIVAFAELGDFIDTPVKFYSSGMFMRLGFSVAIHTDPDLLLVDEVLAVGDAAFRLKCYDQMQRLHREGTAIVLVSHSIDAIRLMAPRALLIDHGRLAFDGPIEEAVAAYHGGFRARSDDVEVALHERKDRGAVVVTRQDLLDEAGQPVTVAERGHPLVYRVELQFMEDVETPQLFFFARDEAGTPAYTASSAAGRPAEHFRAGDRATVEVPFVPRFGGGGTYAIELFVTDRDSRDLIGHSPERTHFYVTPRPGTFGVADLDARIRLDGRVVDDHPSMTIGSIDDTSAPITGAP